MMNQRKLNLFDILPMSVMEAAAARAKDQVDHATFLAAPKVALLIQLSQLPDEADKLEALSLLSEELADLGFNSAEISLLLRCLSGERGKTYSITDPVVSMAH